MHKELSTIKIIRKCLVDKNFLKNHINNITEMHTQLSFIMCYQNNNIHKFNSLYILNYIKEYITSIDVAKRKTSARVFEDLIAILFNGSVTDGSVRKNLKLEVPDYFKNAKDKIAGNKREKVDIKFDTNNNYFGISVKTLMPDNFEINMGSFEKQVLFDGFNVSEYLKERKSIDVDQKGLGSSNQLKGLLNYISANGQYREFMSRFIHMFNYIFADDLLVLIKNISSIDLYFINGFDLCEFFSSKIDTVKNFTSIVNRWEGNSIRIDRRVLLTECKSLKLTLDLNVLDETVISLINTFDINLHESYVSYFNEKDEHNGYLKNRKFITNELNKLFDEFEEKFEELSS